MAVEMSCSCAVEHFLSRCVSRSPGSSFVQSALLFAVGITEFINAILLTQSNLEFEDVYFVFSREVFHVVSLFALTGHTENSV